MKKLTSKKSVRTIKPRTPAWVMAELQKAKAKKMKEGGSKTSANATSARTRRSSITGGRKNGVHLATDILTPEQQIKLLNAKVQRLTARTDDLNQQLAKKNRIIKRQQEEIDTMRRELSAKTHASRLSMDPSQDIIETTQLYDEIERLKGEISKLRVSKGISALRASTPRGAVKKKKMRTKWHTCLDPKSEKGTETWTTALDFCSLRDIGNVACTCKELRDFTKSSPMKEIWKEIALTITEKTFGEELLDEVSNFPDIEGLDSKSADVWRTLCRRIRTCHFLGIPAGDEEDDVSSCIVIDVGVNEVRVGADIKDYASPLIVPCARDMSYENKLRRAIEHLMGSATYLSSIKLWIVPSVSLEWRSHEEEILKKIVDQYAPQAIGVAPPGVPAIFGSGKRSGLVVEMGARFTYVEPICDGVVISHACRFLPIGGEAITELLERHLEGRGYGLRRDVVEAMKKDVCEVIRDPASMQSLPDKKFQIDRSTVVTISGRVRAACPECLFDPRRSGKQLDGLHSLIHECVMDCPVDTRRGLMKNIMIVGGVAATPGMRERLERELKSIEKVMEVNVRCPADSCTSSSPDRDRQEQCQWAMYRGAWNMLMNDDQFDYIDKSFMFLEDYEDSDNKSLLLRRVLAAHQM